MRLSPPIAHRTDTRHSYWPSAGSAETRGGPQHCPAVTAPVLSRNARSARSPRTPTTISGKADRVKTLRCNLLVDAAAKSP
jgi:hypothetical protein